MRKGPTAIWTPLRGPQTEAIHTQADHLFFGGGAGGGKSDCLLGTALTQHQRSITREFKQLEGLRERAEELYGDIGRWNGQKELWRLVYGGKHRRIEFGAVQLIGHEKKYQGRPHDLKGFDEISQFRFLIGWNRSADPTQRTRVICTGNPPTDAEGDWVIKYWGPWLDKSHPNPAKPGELRWFATINGKDVEVEGPQPIIVPGEAFPVQPHSRTFIKALVQDNPFYLASGYMTVLRGLPEPLRSQMFLGDFGAGREDDPYQVIPTEWVLLAQARWQAERPGPIDTIGADIARGGKDKTVLTPRSGVWFGEQESFPGKATPDAWEALQHIISAIPSGEAPAINIDVIGVGASVYDLAVGAGLDAFALDARTASDKRDKSGKLGFVNKRAEWWWSLREALDPLTGDDLALPPDRELMADLTAPRWSARIRGIQIEEKDDIIKRIGRSPDKGERAWCSRTPSRQCLGAPS